MLSVACSKHCPLAGVPLLQAACLNARFSTGVRGAPETREGWGSCGAPDEAGASLYEAFFFFFFCVVTEAGMCSYLPPFFSKVDRDLRHCKAWEKGCIPNHSKVFF